MDRRLDGRDALCKECAMIDICGEGSSIKDELLNRRGVEGEKRR
jgi:hypothetical protein